MFALRNVLNGKIKIATYYFILQQESQIYVFDKKLELQAKGDI